MARIFVSYSRDSEGHKERVLELAHALLAVGHDVMLDRFTGAPSEGWPRWMARQIRDADRVVCVCTSTSRSRFEGDETKGGLGVSWEGHLLTTGRYLNRGRTERVVPVFAERLADVPFALQAHEPTRSRWPAWAARWARRASRPSRTPGWTLRAIVGGKPASGSILRSLARGPPRRG